MEMTKSLQQMQNEFAFKLNIRESERHLFHKEKDKQQLALTVP